MEHEILERSMNNALKGACKNYIRTRLIFIVSKPVKVVVLVIVVVVFIKKNRLKKNLTQKQSTPTKL